MKRSIIKLGIFSSLLLGGYFFNLGSNSEIGLLNDLAFENIEAIAKEETPGGNHGENYSCYGYGDIDCHGYKVEKAYIGLSLD